MYRLPRSLTLRHTPSLTRRPNVRIPRIRPRTQTRAKSTRVWYHSDGTPIRLQTVRFKKPGIFTMRRLATLGLYTGIVYGYMRFIWSYMDVEIEFLDDEEEDMAEQEATQSASGSSPSNNEGEGEEEEEEEEGPPFYADEESTFIPLTWSKKLPRTYYRGSDPEWQEFIKIARDKPRHRKIQDELVQIIFSGSAAHPSINRQLGKDLKVGKYWLDISFPDGPPQEYERSGIEIGDGFVAWSQQRVSQEKQWRTMRALWPQATAESSWATVKVLGGIQWRRLKGALGWEVDPHAPEERFRVAAEMMQGKQRQQEGKEKVGKAVTAGEVVSRSDASTSTSSPAATSTPAARSSRSSQPSSEQDARPFWMPSVPIPSYPLSRTTPTQPTDSRNPSSAPAADLDTPANLDIPIAKHVFQSTLSKTWNPKKMEPPRGTFVVQGLVEVRGARGRMLFDVSSAYDPRAGKYVQVNAAVRGFKRWSQPPRGGP